MDLGLLLGVIVVLALIGFALWAVITYVPMAAPFPQIITVIVVLCLVLWVLSMIGIVPRFR